MRSSIRISRKNFGEFMSNLRNLLKALKIETHLRFNCLPEILISIGCRI
jgi:hypothetical protein